MQREVDGVFSIEVLLVEAPRPRPADFMDSVRRRHISATFDLYVPARTVNGEDQHVHNQDVLSSCCNRDVLACRCSTNLFCQSYKYICFSKRGNGRTGGGKAGQCFFAPFRRG